MWQRRLLAQTPAGPVRKPDIHDPGSRGSSSDETFILSFVFLFSLLLPCYPTLQMSFVAADPVIVATRNKASVFFVFSLLFKLCEEKRWTGYCFCRLIASSSVPITDM